MSRAPERRPKGIPMSQKHRRGNRELKKPKQDKSKVVVDASVFQKTLANPVKAAVSGKRK
jgi:hypothetical protein